MTITEAQDVSILIRALQGGDDLSTKRVIEACTNLKERVHKALYASPDVNDQLVAANIELLAGRSTP